MPKKNIHTQELRLLHQTVTLLRKNMNTQLDELQTRIEILLPQRRTRNLTLKEINERIDAC